MDGAMQQRGLEEGNVSDLEQADPRASEEYYRLIKMPVSLY